MLYFFESSALAKFFHEERDSAMVAEIFSDRRNRAFTARLTVVELTSVAAIKVRTEAISVDEASRIQEDVSESVTSQRFLVIRILEVDYNRAQMLLTRYAAT